MKMTVMNQIVLFTKRTMPIFFCTFLTTAGMAQSFNDTTKRKSIIKFDLTSLVIYSNAFNFTYERVLKNNQTLGITLGYQELPTLKSLITNDWGRY